MTWILNAATSSQLLVQIRQARIFLICHPFLGLYALVHPPKTSVFQTICLSLEHVQVDQSMLLRLISEPPCNSISLVHRNHHEHPLQNVDAANVCSCQATVYDDLHMGDSIGVVVHYTNEETKHTPGGVSFAQRLSQICSNRQAWLCAAGDNWSCGNFQQAEFWAFS